MVTQERRRHPRFPFLSKGEIRIDCVGYRGRLLDFSQYGALFECGIHLAGLTLRQKCSLDILQLNDRSFCTAPWTGMSPIGGTT